MVHIRCVEGVNGCKSTSGDLLITQRSGPAKVSTSGTQWSLVGHFIHPRLTLCCSNSCLEMIIMVQSVGAGLNYNQSIWDTRPPPGHNLCHSRAEIIPRLEIRKSMNESFVNQSLEVFFLEI